MNDRPFRDALKEVDWPAEDLWQAIAGTALLLPLDEPWQEIHPAIRRLLYRYFYAEEKRTDAHPRAAEFTRYWADKVTGQEQVNGMVESIWHEAVDCGWAAQRRRWGRNWSHLPGRCPEDVRESDLTARPNSGITQFSA